MTDRSHWRGAKLLKEWRGDRPQQEIASLIGIDLARYNAFEKNRARPGLKWAVRIDEVSRGAVPVRSWVESVRTKRAA